MEYNDSERAREVALRTREFVDDVVIPVENDVLGGGPVSESQVDALRAEARDRGIYAPQMPTEYGGEGMNFREMLPAFEESGRSLLGPTAMNVQAPDEGNMHLLELVGTEDQQERWLAPLVAGDVKSGFSMTEPLQGAGSDPKMIQTTAERDGDEWVINGHKWWTTQGSEADVLIVFARTDQDAHPYEGCSTFLVPAETDGVNVVRDIPHVGGGVTGMGHAEIAYDDVRVPEANLLGDLNAGFRHVQERLGPARLTHCMRYSGMATRALEIAKAYTSERQAFDTPLAEKQAVRHAVADAETKVHAVRTMVRHAADQIAAGEEARVAVSMSKVYAANTVQETIDLAMQYCGGNGIGKDLPLADFYEDVRQFRIIDGADEVHRRVIARDAYSDVTDAHLANVTRYGDPSDT
ncbi:acyl-CoA dehydrogenase family protein [Halorubellus salinus]|uniref:acyl-CoA dehydrogenase family protein n=1 Tax=Halorubellus salinus TaxID=755309 RepID=UPI001D095694|nr:acyl-CoA dehydrogenase family protein [Halorubellus salinus]